MPAKTVPTMETTWARNIARNSGTAKTAPYPIGFRPLPEATGASSECLDRATAASPAYQGVVQTTAPQRVASRRRTRLVARFTTVELLDAWAARAATIAAAVAARTALGLIARGCRSSRARICPPQFAGRAGRVVFRIC